MTSVVVDIQVSEAPPPSIPMPIVEWRVPDVGEFVIARHDSRRPAWFVDSIQYSNGVVSYTLKNQSVPRSIHMQFKKNPPESALPETVQLWGEKPADFVPLTEQWQWWWFNVLNIASQGSKTQDELLKAWESLTAHGRAFTDFHSRSQGYTDYVLGVNLEAKKPMQHKSLTCGGNILRKIGVYNNYVVVEALDLTKSPPDPAETIKKPWLIHWATQETVIKTSSGKWRVINFPQLRPHGTPFPVVSTSGENWILKSDVDSIPNETVFSPYVTV